MKVRICTDIVFPEGYIHKKPKNKTWIQSIKGKHFVDIENIKCGIQILNNGIVRISITNKEARRLFKEQLNDAIKKVNS